MLAHWLVALVQNGYAHSTCRLYLAALRAWHRARGFAPPSAEPARQALRLASQEGLLPRRERAHPLLAADLKTAVALLRSSRNWSRWRIARDVALLLVGWCGALRVSELVRLRWSDVQWTPEGLVVTVRAGKSDKWAEGATVGLAKASDFAYCPATALETWRNVWTERWPENPWVWPRARGKTGPEHLSERCVGLVLARVGALLGQPLKTHSLRAGFATEAGKRGKAIHLIQAHLRHKSPAMTLAYIREANLLGPEAAGKGLL